MKERVIAQRYARALLYLYTDEQLAHLRPQLLQLKELLQYPQSQLRKLCLSPSFQKDEQRRVVEHVALACGWDIHFKILLMVFLEHGRGKMLPLLADMLVAELEQRLRLTQVTIATAYPLEQGDLNKLLLALRPAVRGTPVPNHRCDPALLGGFQAWIGNTLLDASVSTQLGHLRRRLEQSEGISV